MQTAPLVSIIIPTYNNSPVVCQAIDCALSQTYENKEIIVIDDGSTDDTAQLLKTKYGNRIIYRQQENRGTGGARNTGIGQASGKYLQFLDADDLLAVDKISIQMAQLQNCAERSLSYCQYVYRDMDNRPVAFKAVSPLLSDQNPFDDIMMKWETELCIPIHCFLFDAALFKVSGILFDESLTANEDWECWMDLFALKPKVFYVDSVLAYYRVRSGSRCSDRVKMRNSYLEAIEKQINKNRSEKEIIQKLEKRKKQIKCHYRDVSRIVRALDTVHPAVKNFYVETMPWRLQRLFD